MKAGESRCYKNCIFQLLPQLACAVRGGEALEKGGGARGIRHTGEGGRSRGGGRRVYGTVSTRDKWLTGTSSNFGSLPQFFSQLKIRNSLPSGVPPPPLPPLPPSTPTTPLSPPTSHYKDPRAAWTCGAGFGFFLS